MRWGKHSFIRPWGNRMFAARFGPLYFGRDGGGWYIGVTTLVG